MSGVVSARSRMLSSSVCTSTQLRSPVFQQWVQRLGHQPFFMHRKLWEWAYIAQVLDERGMLRPGRRGLGFAVGKEPLVALFASMGCEVVATDLDEATAAAVGWTETNQHAKDIDALNEAKLCPADEFARRVSFRVVDMNDVPDDLHGFDFVWSSCSIEHLGDIEATERFLSRSMHCLRPGGIAVHTTEYNLTSDVETVESGVTVILRRSDIERMVGRLCVEGHAVSTVDYEIGDAAEDKVILHPPYDAQPCLKIWIGPHAATSIGLIAEAGPNAGKFASRQYRRQRLNPRRARESRGFLPTIRNWLSPWRREPQLVSGGVADNVEMTHQATLEDVRYAYRLLLGREPDPVGFTTYRRLVESGTIETTDLADSVLGSEEFRNRKDGGPIEVDLGGYSMFVRADDPDIGGPILRTRVYEPHVTAVVKRLLRVGDTFVDVGANIGYFMAMGARIVGERGHVAAIEPMDKNLQLLYATAWRNQLSNVRIHPFAASDRVGFLPMATGYRTSNGQIVQNQGAGKLPGMLVQTRTLDDLLVDLERLDLLKIDIEGHELIALRGFTAGLVKHRPRLITEFHPKCMRESSSVDPEAYLAFLFEYTDRIHVLHTDGSEIECGDSGSVMKQWEVADVRLSSQGTTHIDLFLDPRG